MTPRTAGLLVGAVAGLFTIASSIEFAGIAEAHTSAAAWTTATCLPSGAWQATLNITGTNPELHPKATVSNPQAPLNVDVPYTHNFIVPNDQATFTVGIVVDWDDDFPPQDLGQKTATKPDGCVPPTTTTTEAPPSTSTTTSSSTSSSTPPSTDSSLPPVTSVTGPPEAPSTSAASSTRLTQPTGQTPINLPPTGSGPPPLVIAIAAGLIIAGLILIRRSRTS